MTDSRKTNFILLIIASIFGVVIACGMLFLGIFGFVDSRQQNMLRANGVFGTAEIIDERTASGDCFQVKYRQQIDGVTYEARGLLDIDQSWSDCLEPADRVQAKQFGTVQVIYLADRPEVSNLAGPAYFDLPVSQTLATLCLGGGLLLPLSLLFGWWRWIYRRDEPNLTDSGERKLKTGPAEVYPLFSQVETLGQKIGLVYVEHVPAEPLAEHLEQLQATYDDIDQWVFVDHFGKTPLGEQRVTARFTSSPGVRKPTLEAAVSLCHDLASHPDFDPAMPLTVKSGLQTFEVGPELDMPLIPLLARRLPQEKYLILSNTKSEVADYQVQSIIFPSSLDQKVCVVRHPRYPSSGRYPSRKVLDLVQAESETTMHLHLVVPRKEGRGQKFEVHSSYQSVPIASLSADGLFAIARAIHAAGLASDEIRLADYPSDLTLTVAEDLSVTAKVTPEPLLTRIEYKNKPQS